ncbi:peptidoglycan-binding protein [Paraburkholderia graminis]|uniref:Peptidoglycan binding-like domain-containing protein n=1 Tax=Paraburkholderia graminis TaxID=60548 RepID=A0ABD5CEZ0_9BURK|nr:peptidoglycan-binding protein [Paraburkholderia graminis]MDR6202507.1 hypothetical protein [Paraburkholderia graminis]
MKPVYAFGSSGALVERLQSALSQTQLTLPDGKTGNALDPHKIDGRFGVATRAAVRLVQRQQKLLETGTVDAALWKNITGEDWPSEFARELNLLASFEGHGYTKATNNQDDAGITWGIIGFTLVSANKAPKTPNSLAALLGEIIKAYPDYVKAAFGEARAKELEDVLPKSGDELFAFANRITLLPTGKHLLLPEWETGFAALGEYPEVRTLQEKKAKALYYDPAMADSDEFSKPFDMDCEQTRQLFFDMHVHNGPPGSALKKKMKDALTTLGKSASVTEKLLKIADVLVSVKKAYKDDTLAREGAIARGWGKVHGAQYRLNGWGIEVQDAKGVHDLALGVLAFEPFQVREQLTLAHAARALVNPEIAVLNAGAWPTGNGTELLVSNEGGETTMSLSYRPLLSPSTSDVLGPDPQALNLAIAESFSRPVGILGVFGQSVSLAVVTPRLVVGRGPLGYAGLDIKADGGLMMFRQRLVTEAADDASMDIADIRAGLRSCQLILLFGSNGIESGAGQPSAGRLWRELLFPFGASPIVVGWFGVACVPRDADAQFVSGTFLDRVRNIDTKATIEDLCAKHGAEIVQAWGKACHDTFASGQQRFLWRHGPFSDFEKFSTALASVGLSGAAAIDRDGKLWRSAANYPDSGDAMEQVS